MATIAALVRCGVVRPASVRDRWGRRVLPRLPRRRRPEHDLLLRRPTRGRRRKRCRRGHPGRRRCIGRQPAPVRPHPARPVRHRAGAQPRHHLRRGMGLARLLDAEAGHATFHCADDAGHRHYLGTVARARGGPRAQLWHGVPWRAFRRHCGHVRLVHRARHLPQLRDHPHRLHVCRGHRARGRERHD